jgi:hypothetical protein
LTLQRKVNDRNVPRSEPLGTVMLNRAMLEDALMSKEREGADLLNMRRLGRRLSWD